MTTHNASNMYATKMPELVSPAVAFDALRRRKLLTVTVTIVLFSALLAVIFSIRSFYDASATILIETRRGAFSDLQASGEMVSSDVIALRTQADIILSARITGEVVKQLDLVNAPEYTRLLDPRPSILSRLIAKTSETLTGVRTPAQLMTASERQQTVENILRGQVVVSNVGRSYAMELKVRTGDPELSARIANAYTDAYVAFNRSQKQNAITRGSDLLEAQIGPLRERARATQAAVERYRGEHGLVLNSGGGGQVGQGTTLSGQQLYQLNSELSAANTELAQKEASFKAVQGAQKGGPNLYSLPDVLASPVIQKLKEQESVLLNREAVSNPVRSESNPLLQSSRAEISSIRRQIDAEVMRIVSALAGQVAAVRSKRDSLSHTVAALQEQVAKQNEAGVALKQLESEAQAARTVYGNFLDRYEQASNRIAMQEPDVSVVAAAQLPLSRAGPPRRLYGAIAALVASFGGVLTALVFDRFSNGSTIRTLKQLESSTGLLSLGLLPNIPRHKRSRQRGARLMAARQALGVMRQALRTHSVSGRAQVILVTSAMPEEGKTWFTVSLALHAQQSGDRTLIVDWDVRQPNVLKTLGLAEPESWYDDSYVGGDYVLRRNVAVGLDIVSYRPESPSRPGAPPRESFLALIKASQLKYDFIVVDSPPLLLFADAATIAPVTDGVLMLVRWQRTSAAAVREGLHTLQMCGARVMGGVLTRVNSEKLLASETGSAAMYANYARYLRRSRRPIGLQ